MIALAVAGATAWGQQAAPAGAAEIVLLMGNGERRELTEESWRGAAVRDRLLAGATVRTLANSQMGLLLADRTQLRLNQNSQLQIKTVAEASQWTESTVRLNAGRAWSQARPQTAPSNAPPGRRLIMETPTATIGVRGTDWEVEVDPEGRTRVVVLSGEVDVSNAHGGLTLAPGEAALAEAGRAPVRLQLVNPRGRVQWVSSWRPQPRRWGPNPARVQADLLVYQGELAQAEALLVPLAASGAGDPLASALLAYVFARQDRLDAARQLLAAAVLTHPREPELRLAAGDIAVLHGDAAAAEGAYQAGRDLDPDSAAAWYGLGVVASERERVAEARARLAEALHRDTGHGAARAELGATETFAGNLGAGRLLLEELLAVEPANYQALTALGLNRLKAGDAAAALERFMKAGLVEPRYARAWLYSGVAFYQLGERERALQAFARASELDPLDPVPHLYAAMVRNDAFDPGGAFAAAREAQQRMPYLRSLNQVASNQKGNASLGTALASFGLEEWAADQAARAYSPFWGGAHLFAADRHTGKFNRNSELFQGYLTEPTAFGASQRPSSLVPTPGHHGRIELVAERSDVVLPGVAVAFNGLVAEPVPIAYFVGTDRAVARARDDGTTQRGGNVTLGLGARPRHELGLFAFATDTVAHAHYRQPELTDDPRVQREQRIDLGANYKLQPDHQVWLKAGRGSQDNSVSGALFSRDIAAGLNRALNTSVITPAGALDGFASAIEQQDVQWRHAFTLGGAQWSWGAEHSVQRQRGDLATTFAPVTIAATGRYRLEVTEGYLSTRFAPAPAWQAALDVFAQRVRGQRADGSTLAVQVRPPQSFVVEDLKDAIDVREWNPRAGLRWDIAPQQSVRLVAQRWRRPASVGTLAPVDTLGIALDDRLVNPGGLYRSWRLQYDGELAPDRFLRVFAASQRIDNAMASLRTAISDFQLTQLEQLQSRPDVFSARSDLEDTPQFSQGRVNAWGVAFNMLAGRQHALAVRYLHREAWQSGAGAGLAIPFVPRHFAQVDSQWSFAGQWLLGASATWRSHRFQDDRNTLGLDAGWNFALKAYRESADRRHVAQVLLENLLPNRRSAVVPDARLVVRYGYRF